MTKYLVSKREWLQHKAGVVDYRCGHPSQTIFVGPDAKLKAYACAQERGLEWGVYALSEQ